MENELSYYRYFEDKLLRHLKKYMNFLLNIGRISESWTGANIALIPKESQVPALQKKNY